MTKSQKPFSVLFVCTGNIFRSMSAEYSLKQALEERGDIHVASAGLVANPSYIYPPVLSALQARGIDPTLHRQRKVSQQIIEGSDLVVAMGHDHFSELQRLHNVEAKYFLELAGQGRSPIPDIHEALPLTASDEEKASYAISVVNQICDLSSQVLAKILSHRSNRG